MNMYSPGTWVIKQFSSYIEISSPHKDFDTQLIAAVHPGGKGKVEYVANAYLIASAPDLHAELKKANTVIRKLAKLVRHYGYKDEMPALRNEERATAIAKVEVQGVTK